MSKTVSGQGFYPGFELWVEQFCHLKFVGLYSSTQLLLLCLNHLWFPLLSLFSRRSQVIEKFEALDIENAEHMETNASGGAALSSETRQGRSEKRVFPRKRVRNSSKVSWKMKPGILQLRIEGSATGFVLGWEFGVAGSSSRSQTSVCTQSVQIFLLCSLSPAVDQSRKSGCLFLLHNTKGNFRSGMARPIRTE